MIKYNDVDTFGEFKDKVILISGGNGHLGTVCCDAFIQNGATVVSLDLYEEEYSVSGDDQLHHLRCDLSSQEDIVKAEKYISEKFGRLDVLVNNAAFVGTSGLTGWVVPFEEQSIDTWQKALDVNLTSVFALSQAVANLLRKSETGTIVNISSIYGLLGPDNSLYEGTQMGNPAAYAASKGGVNQLTRWLATTLAPDIRVNALCLGGLERGQDSKFQEKYCERTPLKRMGTEEDMIGPILFLSSLMSRYITGQVISVDGGWSAW